MLISRSFVVAVMFGEFIWFLNKEWQNVSVKRASETYFLSYLLLCWAVLITCCDCEVHLLQLSALQSVLQQPRWLLLSGGRSSRIRRTGLHHPPAFLCLSLSLLSFYVIISFMFSCPPLKCRSEAPHSGSITTGTSAGCWRNVVFVNE